MSIVKLVRTASPAASYLAGASLASLVIKILLLNRWPAGVAGLYELGVIFEAVLASIVASYAFYLIVIHMKELSDRETVAPYVNRHSMRVVADCEDQLRDIGNAGQVSLSLDTLTIASLTEALSRINPYSNAPLMLSPENKLANWIQYFQYYRIKSRESITRVITQLQFLDARHVILLTSIDDCAHFSMLSHMSSIGIGNRDLAAFAQTFHLYCQHCVELKQFMSMNGETTP